MLSTILCIFIQGRQHLQEDSSRLKIKKVENRQILRINEINKISFFIQRRKESGEERRLEKDD